MNIVDALNYLPDFVCLFDLNDGSGEHVVLFRGRGMFAFGMDEKRYFKQIDSIDIEKLCSTGEIENWKFLGYVLTRENDYQCNHTGTTDKIRLYKTPCIREDEMEIIENKIKKI